MMLFQFAREKDWERDDPTASGSTVTGGTPPLREKVNWNPKNKEERTDKNRQKAAGTVNDHEGESFPASVVKKIVAYERKKRKKNGPRPR